MTMIEYVALKRAAEDREGWRQKKDVKNLLYSRRLYWWWMHGSYPSSCCPMSQIFPLRYSVAACLNVITLFLQCFCQITMLNRRAKYTVFYDAFICHAVCKWWRVKVQVSLLNRQPWHQGWQLRTYQAARYVAVIVSSLTMSDVQFLDLTLLVLVKNLAFKC